MVFMSASVIDYVPLTEAWLAKLNPMQGDVFRNLITHCFGDIYNYYLNSLKPKMDVSLLFFS